MKSGGLLIFTEEEEKWISALNFRGKTGKKKYMQMAAYLFELGYELALARRDNHWLVEIMCLTALGLKDVV